ncbi:hypothetical protein [Peterkaempfera sp. SMS 1(5)a]
MRVRTRTHTLSHHRSPAQPTAFAVRKLQVRYIWDDVIAELDSDVGA